MVWFDISPVFSDHLKDPAADPVALDGAFGDLFTDDDGNPAVTAVFVLGIGHQKRAASRRLAMAVQVAQTSVAVKAVLL